MDPTLRYRINSPDVVQEGFEDEVIVVNLRAGAYYTLSGAGTSIWRAIERSESVEGIRSGLVAAFRGEADAMHAAADALIRQLEAEALIVALPSDAAGLPAMASGGPEADRPVFVEPELTKYTDMRDLLVLDPIHDVDDSGWPARRP